MTAPPAAPGHHCTRTEIAPDVWDIARPERARGLLERRRLERQCRKTLGHCWHPTFLDWFCCGCGAGEDRAPTQRCRVCRT